MPVEEILSRIGSILLVILSFWWIYIPLILFFLALKIWVWYKEDKYFYSWKWVHLEIRTPQLIERPFKAMEQVFAGFHGLRYTTIGFFKDKLFGERAIQEWVACEIVSLGGEIHFFVHVPERFRNLVEAQIYGQFTDAEIREVQDYMEVMPVNVTQSNYELFGSELTLAEADAVPIRTYPYFEELKPERTVDPLSSVLESCGQIKEGEQAWFQILARPTGDKWKKEGERMITKIMGREEKAKPSIAEKIGEQIFWGTHDVLEEVFSAGPAEGKNTKKESQFKARKELSPGEKEIAEAIETNMSKFGFEISSRLIYIAEKDKFDKNGFNALAAAFRQFSTQHLNRITVVKKSLTFSPYPIFKKKVTEKRKSKIYSNYRLRKFNRKYKPFIFTTEELATIYHFPTITIEAPLVSRLEAKKGEPPGGLPVK